MHYIIPAHFAVNQGQEKFVLGSESVLQTF
jgi:hypothetical protein